MWNIRFHAFHSILMAGFGAAGWGVLRLIEGFCPWLLATLVKELRFAALLEFVVMWAVLLVMAYSGGRCAPVPPVHNLAVRLARRFQKDPLA